MYYSELKEKDVICAKDCRNLGHIADLEIDSCKGCITAVLVRESRWCSIFGCGEEIRIPFHKICKIGPDIILVDLQ